MTKIIDCIWKPATNGWTIMQRGPGDGSLQILVDEFPKYVYRKQGDFYFSEIDNFCSVYKYVRGSKDGFAGRTTTLKMEDGTEEVFHGSLWYPFSYPDYLPPICSISITEDPEVMKRGYTFYAGYVLKSLYDELRPIAENKCRLEE